MQQYRKPSALVLTTDGAYYNTGEHVALTGKVDLSHLGQVLGAAARVFGTGGEGVVMLDRSLTDVDRGSLIGRSWNFTQLRPWTTFHRQNGTTVHLGLIKDLEEQKRIGPLLHNSVGPADMAYRLGRYNEVTGTPWRYTAGVTGCAMLRRHYQDPRPGKQPLWQHEVTGMRGAGPLLWTDIDARPRRTQQASVHLFDVNAMYLAALKNARLAWGMLKPYGGPFDPAYAGWWEIDVRDLPAELYNGKGVPPVFPARHVHKGAVWLTTPVVKYLVDLGHNPDVLDAHIDENAQTLARPVAERLIEARAAVVGAENGHRVLPSIKRTYAELVGMMARPGGSIFRPDWSATIQDLARVNMFRRLQRAAEHGFEPFEVKTDAVAYLVPDTDADARARLGELLGVGTGPGTFKYVTSFTAAEWVKHREPAK